MRAALAADAISCSAWAWILAISAGGVLRDALGLGLRFALRFGAQGGDFRFQVGQAPLHFGRARLGFFARFAGLDHVLADLLRSRGEERPAVLAAR